jgi:acetamidase/formamidase
VAGTSLYVPVFVNGALLWSGDSHAGQGNGEVNLTAMETAYKELNITVEVLKGMKLEWPRIETPTHWITIGYDPKLNAGWDLLKSETSKFLVESRKVSKDEADKIMVRQWDCRISEVVNIVKGTYCMNPKSPRNGPPLPAAENAQYYVTVTKDADLDKAMDGASMAMINLLQQQRKLTRLDAYGLASIAMDCRLAPPAAGDEKSVHCLMPKSVFVARR